MRGYHGNGAGRCDRGVDPGRRSLQRVIDTGLVHLDADAGQIEKEVS